MSIAPHLRPLTAAIEAGCCVILVPQRDPPKIFGRHPNFPERPHIWHIGDDTDVCLGPQAFHGPSLDAMFACITGFGVMVAQPQLADYTLVAGVSAVLRYDSCIVECRSEHEADWVDYAKARATKRLIGVVRTVRPEGRA